MTEEKGVGKPPQGGDVGCTMDNSVIRVEAVKKTKIVYLVGVEAVKKTRIVYPAGVEAVKKTRIVYPVAIEAVKTSKSKDRVPGFFTAPFSFLHYSVWLVVRFFVLLPLAPFSKGTTEYYTHTTIQTSVCFPLQ